MLSSSGHSLPSSPPTCGVLGEPNCPCAPSAAQKSQEDPQYEERCGQACEMSQWGLMWLDEMARWHLPKGCAPSELPKLRERRRRWPRLFLFILIGGSVKIEIQSTYRKQELRSMCSTNVGASTKSAVQRQLCGVEHMTVLWVQGGSAMRVSSCIKSLYLRPSGKSKSWLNQ